MATFSRILPIDVRQVTTELEQSGWLCLEDVISADWLSRAQAHVLGLLEKHGRKFFSIVRPADLPGSVADELVHHPMMQSLLRQITKIAFPRRLDGSAEIFNMLRIVAGPHGDKGSCQFHYDASVVTALVPIFMPDPKSGQSGDFIVFPNKRGYRALPINLLEKLVVQNPVYRWLTMQKLAREPQLHRRLLKPGNIYLFFGYRSYHGNLPCHSHALRATMLLHCGNPHGERTILKAFQGLHIAAEKRRVTRPPTVPGERRDRSTRPSVFHPLRSLTDKTRRNLSDG